MTLTIRDKADTIGTLRFISVHLMETLARWVPSTPEMEVKVLFGRHVWDLAQHADALGKRTAELRAALHYSLRPVEPYMAALDLLAAEPRTPDRLDAFYDAMVPELEARYRAYLGTTDALLDDPSVRIIERILLDLARMRAERQELREQLPQLPSGAPFASRMATLVGAVPDYVAFRPVPAGAGAAS